MKFITPGSITKKYSNSTIVASFDPLIGYEKTSSAMDQIAKSELSDLKDGRDNYYNSFSDLMDGFDTFSKEYNQKMGTGYSTGDGRQYDKESPNEMTILLLWQLRHVCTHCGGVIDEDCKNKYEKTLKMMEDGNISPSLNLPKELEIGFGFTFNKEEYFQIKSIVFSFIEKRLGKKDTNGLRMRSGMSNGKITNMNFHGEFDGVRYSVKYEDLDKISKYPIKRKSGIDFEKHIVDWYGKRVIFISDGTSAPLTTEIKQYPTWESWRKP